MSDTSLEQAAAAEAAQGSDLTGSGATQELTFSYTRSPQDVLRLIAFAVAALVLALVTMTAEDVVLAVEEDVIRLFDGLSPTATRIVQGGGEILVIVVTLVVYAVPLVTKRYRLFGYIFVTTTLAALLMAFADWVVDRQVSTVLVNQVRSHDGLTGDDTGPAGIAWTSAVFITIGPFVTRRWRRAGVVVIVIITTLELLASTYLPASAFLALPVGALCGAAVLLLFGRPDRRPTLTAIGAALENAGLPVIDVHPATVDARGSTPYFASTTDGRQLFVKVLGSQERAADLLFRVYRFLRFRDVGDDRPFSSLRRAIEHEALVALMARDIGVRTPRLRGVVDVGSDSMLLAYELVDGRSLDGVADDEITDDLMRGVWEQIAVLLEHRIAHRDLRRANIFISTDGRPWLIDFGFSEVAVDDDLLDADIAQLLASFGVVADPERVVRAAVDVLGAERVGDALHRLQIGALSGATQTALKAEKGLLPSLQQEVMRQCGVDEVDYDQLERVSRKAIFSIVVLALATYFLFPQFADLPGIVDEVRNAEWSWTPLMITASALTYVGAAMSLGGSIPDRVPAGPLVHSVVASSFASKLAPAGLGGMALQIRFFQKQGVDRTVAVSGVGLNTIAGVFGHVALIGVFVVWAGRDAFGSLTLPDPKWFALGLGVVVATIVIGLLIPPVRAMMMARVRPVVVKTYGGVSEVLRRPSKVALLIGGSIIITMAYLTTLFLSIEAFGGGLSFATVGAVFLVGSAVAQAAPTPGGLGAVEAALIGGLTAAGLESTVAVPAVFLYRIFTFWVPILPGWLSFQWLQRHDYL